MATYLGRFLVLAKLASEWSAANPVLMNGELGVADPGSSTPVLKVGDGARPWSALPPISGAGGVGSPDYVVGSTETLPPGSFATVEIDNTASPPTISFGIPTGNTGPPNVLSIGTTTTGAPGTPASATITGTAPAQTLNLVIPQGPIGPAGAAGADGASGPTGAPGPANVLSIGTVTTGAAGSSADASITGTTPAQVLNLTIPTGPAGPTGPIGPAGPGGSSTLADPSAVIGLTAVNGVSTFGMRADAAPALSQAIVPTWTGPHTFNAAVDLAGPLKASSVDGISGQVLSSQGAGAAPIWRTASGGSIELGWNFSTAVGTANPGAQKMSLNSAVYSAVTIAVFNSTAFTNFDANTILSLLQAGNRIYIQQRNDATKAVVYEVTAPGTNLTGYWTIPVKYIDSRGTIFPSNADLNCVFILSTSASASANPTGTVGLAVVNGSAATWMRSDAAPPLSQAIAPTWTGQHVWSLPLRGPNGTALLPSHSFSFDVTSGMYLAAAGNVAFSVAGVMAGLIDEGGHVRWNSGTAALPAYAFTAYPGAGMYAGGDASLRFAANGVIALMLDQSTPRVCPFWPVQQAIDGTTAACAYSWSSNAGLGLYREGSNVMGVSVGNFRACRFGTDAGTVGRITVNSNGGSGTAFSVTQDAVANYFIVSGAGACTAASFTTTSARDLKRETGAPSQPASILARLRPILYRLFTDESHEQLGLIAEEVHEVCPQLSDGKAVAYDRLAILLLAAWQDEHAAEAA